MLPLGHIGVNFIILFRMIKNRRNFILLIIGSLLPDIIDKPLGLTIYHGFGNGRLIAHTLIFNLVLLLLIFVFKRKLLIIPIASFLHLIEDEMWKDPIILFYPFFGDFPKKPIVPLDKRLRTILNAYRNPSILFSDALGLALLLFFVGYLTKHQKKFKIK